MADLTLISQYISNIMSIVLWGLTLGLLGQPRILTRSETID
ncbi:hypothetical protein B0I26_10981 [Anoxybacillus vitaminiphilus]|uniref:Uncharacterized protein n=1 Tax=Paranoxybacillus vitaminiphilus TaxID=581036 RepID=A0A327YC42_9BACL|nr:hypothetical protein B0I26_10981 [Anoxybacillus vitaminiphilus]